MSGHMMTVHIIVYCAFVMVQMKYRCSLVVLDSDLFLGNSCAQRGPGHVGRLTRNERQLHT